MVFGRMKEKIQTLIVIMHRRNELIRGSNLLLFYFCIATEDNFVHPQLIIDVEYSHGNDWVRICCVIRLKHGFDRPRYFGFLAYLKLFTLENGFKKVRIRMPNSKDTKYCRLCYSARRQTVARFNLCRKFLQSVYWRIEEL